MMSVIGMRNFWSVWLRSGTGSAISVVDSRGMPATGKAAIQLIGLLKTKLAR